MFLQEFVNEAEREGGIYGGAFEHVGGIACTDDPDFNKLWAKAHLAIEEVCKYLVSKNIVAQEDDGSDDNDTDYEDDDGIDLDGELYADEQYIVCKSDYPDDETSY